MKISKAARIAAIIAAMLITAGAFAENNTAERIAQARKQAKSMTVGYYSMTPIAVSLITEGTYPVNVESSSPYFKIVNATLYVEPDGARLEFTVGSTSYLYVYPGTAKQARKSDETDWIEGTVTDSEETVFNVPVEAVNAPFNCAAYSKRRNKWYPRTLLIDAASLPEDALSIQLPDYEALDAALLAYGTESTADTEQTEVSNAAETGESVETPDIDLEDGEYSIEVNLTGGSGRASVSSPTRLIVKEGKPYARLLWSSSYYDYMIVNGVRYENLNTDGGSSTFEIPVSALDMPITVIADTTAMGDPVEIEYTLIFYEDTVGDTSLIPQVAAKRVLIISAVLIAVGAILNFILKKEK